MIERNKIILLEKTLYCISFDALSFVDYFLWHRSLERLTSQDFTSTLLHFSSVLCEKAD